MFTNPSPAAITRRQRVYMARAVADMLTPGRTKARRLDDLYFARMARLIVAGARKSVAAADAEARYPEAAQ